MSECKHRMPGMCPDGHHSGLCNHPDRTERSNSPCCLYKRNFAYCPQFEPKEIKKIGQKENQEAVFELLHEHGWRTDGHTLQRRTTLAVGTTPRSGVEVIGGGKPRFVSPDDKMKVSVGVRITYFYEPQEDKLYYDWPGISFNTKETDKIHDYIKKLEANNKEE